MEEAHSLFGGICETCGYGEPEDFDGASEWDGSIGRLPEESDGYMLIFDAGEFAAFAVAVNSGNDFAYTTVVLYTDIDLNGHEWAPIGTDQKKFRGVFEGNDKTIYNLNVGHPDFSSQGLFGCTQGAEIRNLTVHNALVDGDLNVGTIAGAPVTTKLSNLTVSGYVRVNGSSYVGGAFGKGISESVDNITISVKEGSYVKADSVKVENGETINYRTYVGGAIGFMNNGGYVVTNAVSNIDVYGSTTDVGGITGMAHYGNSFINCSSSGDIYITKYAEDGSQLEIGGIAGVWQNSTESVTFRNCSFTGTLTAINNEGVKYEGEFENGGLVGRKYGGGKGQLIIE